MLPHVTSPELALYDRLKGPWERVIAELRAANPGNDEAVADALKEDLANSFADDDAGVDSGGVNWKFLAWRLMGLDPINQLLGARLGRVGILSADPDHGEENFP